MLKNRSKDGLTAAEKNKEEQELQLRKNPCGVTTLLFSKLSTNNR